MEKEPSIDAVCYRRKVRDYSLLIGGTWMILLSAVNSSTAIKKKESRVIPIVMIQIIMIRLHQTNPKLPSLYILLLFPFKAR